MKRQTAHQRTASSRNKGRNEERGIRFRMRAKSIRLLKEAATHMDNGDVVLAEAAMSAAQLLKDTLDQQK